MTKLGTGLINIGHLLSEGAENFDPESLIETPPAKEVKPPNRPILVLEFEENEDKKFSVAGLLVSMKSSEGELILSMSGSVPVVLDLASFALPKNKLPLHKIVFSNTAPTEATPWAFEKPLFLKRINIVEVTSGSCLFEVCFES